MPRPEPETRRPPGAETLARKLRGCWRYTPVLLLIAIAAVQIHWAFGRELLAPSKGGGFGLFSTVDRLHSRIPYLIAVDADGSERAVPIARYLARDDPIRGPLQEARAFPSEAKLARVTRMLAERQRTRPGASWRLEVWKQSFEPALGRVKRSKLAAHTLRPPRAGGP